MPQRTTPRPKVRQVEFSMSCEVSNRGSKMWPKVGAVADVSDGMSPDAAYKWLKEWVTKRALENVEEMLG